MGLFSDIAVFLASFPNIISRAVLSLANGGLGHVYMWCMEHSVEQSVAFMANSPGPADLPTRYSESQAASSKFGAMYSIDLWAKDL